MQMAPAGTNNWITQDTAADGYYSYKVAPGEYNLQAVGYSNNTPNAPRYYELLRIPESTLLLTESTVMDIVLPAERVTVHVQDPAGNPVADARIHTTY